MNPTQPLSPAGQKRSFASRLFGYDVFLSFALGPPPRGSHSYASDLARRLEQRDFTVFFSEQELSPGERLDGGLQRALLRSKTLVVISNRGALEDPRWIRKEVEEFRRGRPGRPVIPVNIGGALQEASLAAAAQPWLDFAGRVWVDDTEEALTRGIASQEVVDRLAIVRRSARANAKWRWIVRGSVAALAGLALGLAISTKQALDSARRARAELREAVASRLVMQGQQMLNGSQAGGSLRGILQVLAASRITSTQETAGARLDALLATRNVRKLLATDVPVESVSISPDGQRIASGHDDHTIRLWEVATGQPVGHPLKGPAQPITIVAHSPDGRLLASGTWDGTLQLWDTKTGDARGAPLKAHSSRITGLAFSPDGRRILSCSGVTEDLRIWDTATGRPLSQPTEPDHQSLVAQVVSPDGRGIVSAAGQILYWDADTQSLTGGPIQENVGYVSAVAFSPDGRSVVTSNSSDGTLRLWNPASANSIGTLLDRLSKTVGLGPRGTLLEGHTALVGSLAFSPDGGRIVSGSWDGTVRLWDAVNARPLGGALEGHRARVSSVAFTPDGSVISGSTASEGIESALFLKGLADPTEPNTARIRIWMPGGSLNQLLTFPVRARPVALSPDGRWIATTGDGTLRLWNAVTGERFGAPMEGGNVVSAAVSPNGRRVASEGRDRTILISDVESGRPVTRLLGHDAEVFVLAFSPDGQRLASASWKSPRNVRVSNPPREELSEFRVWDAVTGRLLSVAKARVNSIAFSPDNRRIVSGLSAGIRLWDATSTESRSELLGGRKDFVRSVAFSPDGRLIASGQDKTIRLWDSQTGRAIGEPLHGHRGQVGTVAFSPDGRHLVSGDADNTVRVWDTRSGQPLGPTLEGHTDRLTAVAFSSDGLSIVSAAADNTVRRWPAPKAWLGALCSKVTRNLSPKEWREWVSAEIPYECQCSGLPVPADDGLVEQSRTCNVKSP